MTDTTAVANNTAIVTGGAGGIGAAICEMLGNSGYLVVSVDTKANPNVNSIVIDITNRELTEDLANLDSGILVNAAGITRDNFLHKMSDNDWDDVISVNLNGIYNTTSAVISGMRERKFGRIVNIASVNGQRGQYGQCNYAATKAAVHGFTMSLAQEGAKKNVLVNTISPGYIDTAMTRAMPEQIRDKIVAQIPVGRMGKPADIARTVRFLVSADNTFITGANIPVNGGMFTSF